MEELRWRGQKKSLLVFIVCDLLPLPPFSGFIVKVKLVLRKTFKYITLSRR